MTCTEFLALLDDLIDDSVSSETRAALQDHLRGCDHCEVTLNTTRKTIEIYRSHEIYDLPADLAAGDGSVMTVLDNEAEMWVIMNGTVYDVDDSGALGASGLVAAFGISVFLSGWASAFGSGLVVVV